MATPLTWPFPAIRKPDRATPPNRDETSKVRSETGLNATIPSEPPPDPEALEIHRRIRASDCAEPGERDVRRGARGELEPHRLGRVDVPIALAAQDAQPGGRGDEQELAGARRRRQAAEGPRFIGEEVPLGREVDDVRPRLPRPSGPRASTIVASPNRRVRLVIAESPRRIVVMAAGGIRPIASCPGRRSARWMRPVVW
jgi:hypothetical protein